MHVTTACRCLMVFMVIKWSPHTWYIKCLLVDCLCVTFFNIFCVEVAEDVVNSRDTRLSHLGVLLWTDVEMHIYLSFIAACNCSLN